MSETPSRPSLARQHTRGSDEKTQEELDTGVAVTIEHVEYVVRVGDLSPQIVRELRRNYGGSFNKLMTELAEDPDVDIISTFVWLARRVEGDKVDHDDVAIDYRAMLADGFDIAVAGREGVIDTEEHPEG